ncbi:hypothetical protein HYE82_05405 [Streptomyces sp. BR123]|uniref:hypothetical protein n=1 Tax=Streptomyces sp. BR123 TaxID=2749828 RepID=UPI0015C46812|nr:hypothetical protein [Streptomyces sp. BR123]NXY93839.1 hypothetical protein [Streptomyces sp. BR123]
MTESAEPKRPMSQKTAREFIADAHLVLRDRETRHYEVVTERGTVFGHVEPAYKAGLRSGWAAGTIRPANLPVHATRDQAGAEALRQWIALAIAKPRQV